MFESAQKLITVIIPIFNEYDGIPFLVKSLDQYFKEIVDFKGEVIFVNDGSTDHSAQLIAGIVHESYRAKVINLSRNFGSHAALRAGVAHANGDYICFNYADLQDPLELITIMKAKMEQGNGIVWAHRETGSISFAERVFSSSYAYLMRKFAFSNFPEKGFDIVMFDKKVARELVRNVEANSSVFLQILGLGFRQTSITYKKRDRQNGKSKWTLSKKIKLFVDSFVAFSFAPIRLVSIIGILFFLLGLAWTGYIIFRKLVFNDLESGWPALVSILMLGFGITNIALGIIAEYLWRTLDASRKRPVFIIDEVVELTLEKADYYANSRL